MTHSASSVRTDALVPDSTRLGPVHIAVTDRARALSVWRDAVGLELLEDDAARLVLGAGGVPLIVLYPGAEGPVRQGTIGLYHVAIHVPTRRDFARALNRIARAGLRVSPTDHLVSEALYIWDPDGNGIEITFETPWRGRFVENDHLLAETVDGQPHSGREPIDVEGLMAELVGDATPFAPFPEGTRIGHVHVHVGDLDHAMAFYRDTLGFAGQLLSRRYGMGDVTLDYAPHILAFNIWAGPNAPRPPAGAAGLRRFEIVLESAGELEKMADRLQRDGASVDKFEGGIETADPWGNAFRVVVG